MLRFVAHAAEPLLPEPQRHVHQRDERGDFDQRADHCGEGFAGVDAEHRDRDGDGEFEVIARRREGERGGFGVVRADLAPHPERHEKHDHEVEQERNGDAYNVHRDANDVFALEREHHHNREEQRHQRERADAWHENTVVPLAPFQPQHHEAG